MRRVRNSQPLETARARRTRGIPTRVLDAAGWALAAAVAFFLLSTGCPSKSLPCAGGCPSDRKICDNDTCVECKENADCPPGESCNSDGDCEPTPCGSEEDSTCAGECPAGTFCRPNGDTSCDCQADGVPPCAEESDCQPGDTCLNGECETPCNSPADCVGSDQGPLCDTNGHCVRCRENTDCFSPAVCFDGECGTCLSDADCQGLFHFCYPTFHFCRPCVSDGHCLEGQRCNDGFCEYRFAHDPEVSLGLSNPQVGQSPQISLGISYEKGELEIYNASFRYLPMFTFNGFDVLGPANTAVGHFEIRFNDDASPDASAEVRSIDTDSAYVDSDGDHSFDAGEPTVERTNDLGGTITVTLPNGGDGRSDTIIAPFGGRATMTAFSGIFTNAFPGSYSVIVQATSVDPNSDNANDSQNQAPLTFDDILTVVITGACGDGVVGLGEDCDPGEAGETDVCDSDCTSPFCGDHLVNQAAGEQCDDGFRCTNGKLCTVRRECRDIGDNECELRNGDGCSDTCQLEPGGPTCGDGVVAGAEICDDGNAVPGDGCSAVCTIEIGYACIFEPSACVPICGDHILAGDEECDDGNLLDGDCCSSTCTFELSGSTCGSPASNACDGADFCNARGRCRRNFAPDGTACDDGNPNTPNDQCRSGVCNGPGTVCGDGQVDAGEECDDDNTDNDDGCSAVCRTEPGYDCAGEPSVCTEIPSRADANCDGRLGAADLVELHRLIAEARRAVCGQDDPTGDGKVAGNDLNAAITAIFGAAPP